MVLETSWTVYDKLAGLLALALMTGYYLAPVQGLIAMTVNLVLNPLVTLLPVSILLFGLGGTTGLYSTTLQLLLGDSEKMERLQKRITTLQKRASSSTEGGTNALADVQAELLQSWLAMAKLQFRPLAWSLLLTVPVFLWIRWAMANPAAATIPLALSIPVVGHIALTATLVGPLKVWLVWYIGGSSRPVSSRAAC